MKKILVLSALLSMSAMAKNYGPAGCGLGSVLFEGQTNSKVYQVLAATTNGTSGNQTFGITTGTLNCDTEKLKIGKLNFVEANKFALANDIAKGSGETLQATASFYGCNNVEKAASKLQANYKNIFTSANTDANHIDAKITELLNTASCN